MEFTELTLKKIGKVLKSLEEKGCSVEAACKGNNLSRPTFYKWLKDSEDNKAEFYNILDSRTVEVEDALYEKALKGDTVAILFWLKNRGNDRWADKQEIGFDKEIKEININIKK